ncbi:hypothetical protein EYF80_062769 [Liparis tanakae]|uniref:Uncharacterized protein n=1 Tax=Liparis tanakae TaxID=230148 RepID=A0A4Z2EE97_9TELE|nr:hypothetical protein EYF80_062769 [Liparis tanakae]
MGPGEQGSSTAPEGPGARGSAAPTFPGARGSAAPTDLLLEPLTQSYPSKSIGHSYSDAPL